MAGQIVPEASRGPPIDDAPLVDEAVRRGVELELEIGGIVGEETNDVCVKPVLESGSRIDDLLEHVHDGHLVDRQPEIFNQSPIGVVMERTHQPAKVDGHPVGFLVDESQEDSLSTIHPHLQPAECSGARAGSTRFRTRRSSQDRGETATHFACPESAGFYHRLGRLARVATPALCGFFSGGGSGPVHDPVGTAAARQGSRASVWAVLRRGRTQGRRTPPPG